MEATKIGPHLLGRIPSPKDERDWRIEDFLADDGSLRDQAVVLLQETVRGWNDSRYGHPPLPGSFWIRAMALLAQIQGPTPPPPPPPSQDVVWLNADPTLDQGNFGTCEGNGWAQFGNTAPFDDHYTEKDARAIYLEATCLDGQCDDPDQPGGGQQGATTRSGAKAMVNRKRIAAYAFASTRAAITTWVRTKGPVVMGTDWTEDMFDPDAEGYIAPTGSVAGGHCYVLSGDLASEGAFQFLNSWGSSWGLGGRFKMKYADFDKLFAQQGEAVVALELAI